MAEETREPVVLSETVPVAEVQDVAPEYFDKPHNTQLTVIFLSNLTVEDIITAFQRHVSMDVIDREAFTEIFEDLVANHLQTSKQVPPKSSGGFSTNLIWITWVRSGRFISGLLILWWRWGTESPGIVQLV